MKVVEIDESLKPNALLIEARDDVVTVLQAVREGDTVRWVGGSSIAAREDIPEGHKVAIRSIAQGEAVRKYGWPIGSASVAIDLGELVHTHNLSAVEG